MVPLEHERGAWDDNAEITSDVIVIAGRISLNPLHAALAWGASNTIFMSGDRFEAVTISRG